MSSKGFRKPRKFEQFRKLDPVREAVMQERLAKRHGITREEYRIGRQAARDAHDATHDVVWNPAKGRLEVIRIGGNK